MANVNLAQFFPTPKDITSKTAIAAMLTVEGAYVNHKNDKGGETRYGITKDTVNAHRHLWSKHRFTGDMKTLPRALAYDIYYEDYWKGSGCDIIEQYSGLLAYQVFDVAVNMGKTTSSKFLQTALNASNVTLKRQDGTRISPLTVDGDIGPTTRQAIQSYFEQCGQDGVSFLLYHHLSSQENRYRRIVENNPSQRVFLKGWLNRISSKQVYYDRFTNKKEEPVGSTNRGFKATTVYTP